MPAKDFYHNTVVQALTKAGWMVAQEQVRLVLTKRHVWIDIFALRFTDNAPMFVEIKSFENIPSPVDYLYSAVGQYGMYKAILEKRNSSVPVYMAIPGSASDGIFKEEIGQLAIQYFSLRLIVFDPLREEIIRWIH